MIAREEIQRVTMLRGDHVESAISKEAVSWEILTSAFSSPEVVPSFSNGQMIEYFVIRTVGDGLPAGDFKSMNKRAKGLFDCGHVLVYN